MNTHRSHLPQISIEQMFKMTQTQLKDPNPYNHDICSARKKNERKYPSTDRIWLSNQARAETHFH